MAEVSANPFIDPIAVGILLEADGEIGGIGILHDMTMALAKFHHDGKDPHGEYGSPVHGHDERLVRTTERFLEVIVDRFLGSPGR